MASISPPSPCRCFLPDDFMAYAKTLPFKLPVMEHAHARAALPQWYADQFGWEEIVDETRWRGTDARRKSARTEIAASSRRTTARLAPSTSSAANTACRRLLSGHQTWFLWGPRGYSGNCMIVLDDTPQAPRRTLGARRIRRGFRRQSLRAGKRNRSLHLPRPEVRHPGPTLAADKTLALDVGQRRRLADPEVHRA